MIQHAQDFSDVSVVFALPEEEALRSRLQRSSRSAMTGTSLQLQMYGMGQSSPRLL